MLVKPFLDTNLPLKLLGLIYYSKCYTIAEVSKILKGKTMELPKLYHYDGVSTLKFCYEGTLVLLNIYIFFPPDLFNFDSSRNFSKQVTLMLVKGKKSIPLIEPLF